MQALQHFHIQKRATTKQAIAQRETDDPYVLIQQLIATVLSDVEAVRLLVWWVQQTVIV